MTQVFKSIEFSRYFTRKVGFYAVKTLWNKKINKETLKADKAFGISSTSVLDSLDVIPNGAILSNKERCIEENDT